MKQQNHRSGNNFREFSLKTLILTFLIVLLAVYGLFQWETVLEGVGWLLGVLSPFFMGIAIAFVLNIPVKWLEQKLSPHLAGEGKTGKTALRAFCLFGVLAAAAGGLGLLLFFLVPELIRSLNMLTQKAPFYAQQVKSWAEGLFARLPFLEQAAESLLGTAPWEEVDWLGLVSGFTDFTAGLVGSMGRLAVGFGSGVFRFFFSLLFALYMVMQKESLIGNLRRVMYAFLPWKTAGRLIHLGQLAGQIFSGFISGQCAEALILGLLCCLGMGILGLPYSALISVFVALTSLIPVFGAYFGAAFGGLLLLLSRPWDSVVFLIFFVILQNVEGNFIYPKVVGSSVGLPGIWVMFAILVFGDLFGFLGMLAGVPVCSLLYRILREATDQRLKKRHISNRDAVESRVGQPPRELKTSLVQAEKRSWSQKE